MNRIIYLLIIVAAIFTSNNIKAQACLPDPIYTSPGIYPDSATGWSPADVGVLYSQVITAVVPGDTTVVIFGQPNQVFIDSIVLVKLDKMPSWLSVMCEPPSCAIPGDSVGCGIVTGTPPAGSAGTYKFDLITRTYARLAAFPTSQFDQTDTVAVYFTLVVNPPAGIIPPARDPFAFSIVPNPSSGAFRLNIQMPEPQEVSVTVLNIIGQSVYEKSFGLQSGDNEIAINDLRIPEGNYFVTIRSGDSALTKKLYINR